MSACMHVEAPAMTLNGIDFSSHAVSECCSGVSDLQIICAPCIRTNHVAASLYMLHLREYRSNGIHIA